MLQTSEIRRAVEETHRVTRNFQEYRALQGQSDRRPSSLAALAQATGLHTQAVNEISMREVFPHPVGAFVPMWEDWEPSIASDKGTTPTVLEIGIQRIVGLGITVPMHNAPGLLRDPVETKGPTQRPPGIFEWEFPNDLARYDLDPSLAPDVEAAPAVHRFAQPMLISYTRSGLRNSSVGLPRPVHETDEATGLPDYLTGIAQGGLANRIWEHAIRRIVAPDKPDPVEVFTHIPSQLEALFHEIEDLPEDWNSYGAARISPWSITEARSITNEGMRLGLPAPAVSPASGASVGIEWQTNKADLVIDVDQQQGITYLLVHKASGVEIEGELNVGNRSEVLRKVMGL